MADKDKGKDEVKAIETPPGVPDEKDLPQTTAQNNPPNDRPSRTMTAEPIKGRMGTDPHVQADHPSVTEASVMSAEEKREHESKMGKTLADREREAHLPATYNARNPRGAPGEFVEQGTFNEDKAPHTQDTDWAQALNRHYAYGEPMPTKAHCYCGKDGICVKCNCCEQHCACGERAKNWVEGGIDTVATTNVFSTADLPKVAENAARMNTRGAANYESGKETGRGDVVDDAYGSEGDVTPKG